MKNRVLILILALFLSSAAFAQTGYQTPPKPILDVLNAPETPSVSVSPNAKTLALLTPLRYPPISELAEPMLRLAGLRINPLSTSRYRQPYFVELKFKPVSGADEVAVELPARARVISPEWSADGAHLAFGNVTDSGVELWIANASTGKAAKVEGLQINTAYGGFSWMPDQRSLLVTAVPQDRGTAPAYRDLTPLGPSIQETAGRTGAVATFQDLLKSPNDEKLFEYYATSQLVKVSLEGKVSNIGTPAMHASAEASPDGRFILTERIHKPFSYQFPHYRFPKKVEVIDAASGRPVHLVAEIPLQNDLPVQGVAVGPRSVGWIPTESATLVWAEALDGGDPRAKADHRDKLMKLSAPFEAAPSEIVKIEHRYQGRSFGEKNGMMWFNDYDRDTRRRRVFMTDYRTPSTVKLLSDLNVSDRYNNPGNPVMRTLANGASVIKQNGDDVFLSGAGSSPQGDRPFFRRMDLKTLEVKEIFRSSGDDYETFVAMLDDIGMNFLTRKESVEEPPNLFMRQVCPEGRICTALAYRQITDFKDPAPQLRGITKELVKYKRADGVDLSFTLYLPPNYKKGTRLPALVWAYPLEFTDSSTAGQVSGSTNRFTTIGGTSHLFFLLQGYAVLDAATMPIVGDPETVNDTFVKQIVDSAKAAIDKGAEMGVVDPDRVGVGGHSYGAFMTANLLAHSDIFRAGIARSGAYNRTLTPFGFQSERRTFWEAPEVYGKVSPFFVANKINEPILLIHGEADNNQGTYPMQSERLFAALSGTGGTARLVMLPLESHGYAAKESVEHTLFEMIDWFDRYVKQPKP